MATESSTVDKRKNLEEVRDEDLEPYVTLRYIARLFKVLAILMVVMLIGEVITGFVTEGSAALMTRARSAGVITARFRPGCLCSARAAMPPSRKRFRQREIVGAVVCSRCWMSA